MYGPLHPKLPVVTSLCLGILDALNEKPSFSLEELDGMLPDPLAEEYVWGCHPPLADRLGVNGSWLSRNRNKLYTSMDDYLTELYAFLAKYPADNLQIISRDKRRYNDLHNIDNVVREYS